MKEIMLPSALTKLRGKLQQNVSLADYTSWRVGGKADYVYIPKDLDDLSYFLKALDQTISITWMGLGSNMLVRDGGINGVVIVTQGALKQLSKTENNTIRAEVGIASAQLARHTARLGTTGLEFMAGIPGTVGGALAMNAGCFGGETWQFVQAVETINRQGDVKLISAEEFKVSYRHVERKPDEWFVAGHFKLRPGDKELSLNTIRTLLERRSLTQPTGTANCGSVFRNPVGTFAGKLIEECGLKGLNVGGAFVSDKHANFIINEKSATANDIESLIGKISSIVFDKTGISLTPEVCIIGRAYETEQEEGEVPA